VEVEIRENLGSWWSPLKEFSLGFNAAYIKSKVALTAQQQDIRGDLWLDDAGTRPLFDQPEFVINGDLTWEHATSGTSVTLSGAVVGRRLVLVGLATPDEYEEPAPQLDVFISQKLGKHWKAKLFAKNLLDPTYDVTQEWPGYGKLVIESYTKGITLGLSVSCEF